MLSTMKITLQTFLVLFNILFLSENSAATQAGITINQNGYEGVTIAISEKIQNSTVLIQKIKEQFTEASRVLYKATKYQLYFKDVTIVLPRTWPMENGYKRISGSKFKRAPIRIDEEHPVLGKVPFVFGTPVCGQGGQYMHLTRYLMFAGSFANFGEIGAVLVHEWGHLRWGLFDEYPAAEEASLQPQPSFSNVDNTWEPVRCTNQIRGQRRDRDTGAICSNPLTADGKPNKNCVFIPDVNSEAIASLMGHQTVKMMEAFCDVDDPNTDPSVRHNSRSENNQNTRCNGQSAWEVMRSHTDFNEISPGPVDKDTTPNFNIEIESEQRMCLSLDVSGSMNNNDRLNKMYTSASNFLLNTVATGSSVGIVTFNTVGTIVQQMMTIIDQTSREQLVSRLPTFAIGGTSIGNGILACIRALNVSNDGLPGSIIMLVSDGEETRGPYIADVQPRVVELGIIVTSLALGNEADSNLGTISRASGGKSFFYSEEENSTALVDAFTSTVVEDSSTDINIQIYSFSFRLSSSQSFERPVIIDETIGRDTIFQVITNDNVNVNININVTGPDGTVYTDVKSNSGITTLKIAGVASTGTYNVIIKTTTTSTLSPILSILSKPRSADTSVINANVWLSGDTHSYSSESRTAVYCSVMKGMAPIFKANVFVNIESYKNTTVKQLLDNGIGSDIREDDGIYSGYIFSSAFNGNGRHSLKVDVYNFDNTAEMLVATEKSDTFPFYSGLTTNPVGNFQRIVLTNEITVTNYTSEPLEDVIAPAKITTLSLESVQETTDKIMATFTWKAVGDDLDIGTALEYEIRMSNVFSTIKENPEQSTRFTANIPVPSTAGTTERIVININDDSSTMYFVVRSIDGAGNKGDFSNIVSVSRLTDPTWTNEVLTSSLTLLQIVISGCVACLILVTSVIIYVICIKKISSKKKQEHEKINKSYNSKQRKRPPNTHHDHGFWWHHALSDHRTWLHHAIYDHRPWWYQPSNEKAFKGHRMERYPV